MFNQRRTKKNRIREKNLRIQKTKKNALTAKVIMFIQFNYC